MYMQTVAGSMALVSLKGVSGGVQCGASPDLLYDVRYDVTAGIG